jgi:Tol biopolymer transport system component
MITTGSITLPSGETIRAGQGGSYGIGSDSYPVTIVGWSKSGKTIYYQAAIARATSNSDYYGAQRYLFVADPSAPIQAATWRTGRRTAGAFRPKGSKHGYVSTNGYYKRTDPSF